MKSRTRLLAICAVALCVVLTYSGWMAIRAHRNLVTLNVRNMEVREVVKKIEWQTWENIFVHKDVQGNVTLNVRQMPLEQVLRLVADQTSSRSSTLYALYTSGRSLGALKQSLRGDVDPNQSGWTNLLARGGFRGGPMMMGGGGPFGGPAPSAPKPVSLQFESKDISFVALAFNRYAQTRIVPEDGMTATVSFTLNKATVNAAVAQLAKKARAQWKRVHALRADFGPGGPGGMRGPGDFASRGPGGPGGPGGPPRDRPINFERPGAGGPEVTEAKMDEVRQQRENLETELKQALPAEEREKLEVAQAEREKQMQEMQNMTPEQRAQRFSQMGGGNMEKMNRDRILNTTPEQRARMRPPGGPGGGGRGPGGPPR